MSFLYPRTIAIRRQQLSGSAVGDRGYSAVRATTEDELFSDLPAGIQTRGGGPSNAVGLPSDSRSQAHWHVLIPLYAAPEPGAVVSADIIVDDLGRRFQVRSAIPTSLGLECACIILEV